MHDMAEPEVHGLVARDRDKGPLDVRFPFPRRTTGGICSYCGGTTYVVRANVGLELEDPLTAQIEPCDNPYGCPNMKGGETRKITQLSVPHNNFAKVVSLPSGKITALIDES
jgi:hypothetical protein